MMAMDTRDAMEGAENREVERVGRRGKKRWRNQRGGIVDVVLRGQATAGVLGLGQKEWQKAASVLSH